MVLNGKQSNFNLSNQKFKIFKKQSENTRLKYFWVNCLRLVRAHYNGQNLESHELPILLNILKFLYVRDYLVVSLQF